MEIEMLNEERLRLWCQRIRMPEGAVDALAQVAREVQADGELSEVFRNFYEKTALHGEWHTDWSDLPVDPRVREKMGERTSLFYLLAYLAALPRADREYRRMGVSREIFNDTMLDFSIWVNNAHETHGRWMFDQFSWVWRHLTCQLFRLGRLQFMLSEFPGKVMAFRHVRSGHVLLLGDPETPLRSDGYALDAGGKRQEEERPWYAVFEATPAGWRGNRIMPQGYTLHQEVFLLRSEWEPVLRHGETILDLHIPRGDRLTPEECRESFSRAYAFFPEFFPDRPFKGVYCHTWFFTPQLQKILSPESNLVRFQREFYLYPYPGGPGFLWSYAFGEKHKDPATAPRDTSLQRAVLDWLAENNELFDLPGVMLHSPDQWGQQPYYYAREITVDEKAIPTEAPEGDEPDELMYDEDEEVEVEEVEVQTYSENEEEPDEDEEEI